MSLTYQMSYVCMFQHLIDVFLCDVIVVTLYTVTVQQVSTYKIPPVFHIRVISIINVPHIWWSGMYQ